MATKPRVQADGGSSAFSSIFKKWVRTPTARYEPVQAVVPECCLTSGKTFPKGMSPCRSPRCLPAG
eukprot:1140430-Pelagomonas_calceolata.AAC.1